MATTCDLESQMQALRRRVRPLDEEAAAAYLKDSAGLGPARPGH
jgi:hypothetical protein